MAVVALPDLGFPATGRAQDAQTCTKTAPPGSGPRESRPAGNQAAFKITGGRSEFEGTSSSVLDAVVDGAPARVVLDLVTADSAVREAFWDGFESGYAAGYEAGFAAADDEIGTLQREAARIVHALAGVPQRDADADRRRRERRDRYWAARQAGVNR